MCCFQNFLISCACCPLASAIGDWSTLARESHVLSCLYIYIIGCTIGHTREMFAHTLLSNSMNLFAVRLYCQINPIYIVLKPLIQIIIIIIIINDIFSPPLTTTTTTNTRVRAHAHTFSKPFVTTSWFETLFIYKICTFVVGIPIKCY